MSVLLNYTSAPFERSGKGLKSTAMLATLVARNANEATVGQAESAFGGSMESGGRFCVGAFGRKSLLSQ
jgi:hypothetical protein